MNRPRQATWKRCSNIERNNGVDRSRSHRGQERCADRRDHLFATWRDIDGSRIDDCVRLLNYPIRAGRADRGGRGELVAFEGGRSSAAEPIEEVGESSSPSRGAGAQAGYDIKNEIYERLVASGNEEARSNPYFKEHFDAHFSRLPAR
ncbi:hypothetical protein B296_00021917 [Ensete ventricosum]|uniref:Uncharacterized protein n=1 Tax=Ensete ventricosum TaxID=4639 RepID=A0A426YSZ6_ENSVE|nr:hypothetical protein B296_00021917 [Ensete ventricosum]